ncbi:unnamed protein product [Rhizoctonia solani]|uniref:Protein kinase domain-containing protein n=1 Tax=Rhizoctonia solani TaxID=456999 RepID=A0A8H3BCP1_9AGAM|nr:unnamed protein product [Rhizoctonia solani]
MAASSFDQVNIISKPERRSEAEERWVLFQPYLYSKGYRLRPRYQPHWVPSWKNTNIKPSKCEDSTDSIPIRVLDATRIENDEQVMIKMIVPTVEGEGLDEYDLLKYYSTPSLREHPSNHVVPCLDSFPIPGVDLGHFVVMPLLTHYLDLPFYNIAEVHELLQQLFDGLIFMHEHNTVHRDIASPNIMMDARSLYNEPFHPYYQTLSIDARRPIYPHHRRSEKGIRYYYIDLGYAKWFRDPIVPRLVAGMDAREPAPEQADGNPYDPFPAEVYQLGVILRRDLIPKFDFLRILQPLAQEMTQDNPTERPGLAAARTRMNAAFSGLPGWKYRWPFIPKHANSSEQWGYFWAGLAAELVRYDSFL